MSAIAVKTGAELITSGATRCTCCPAAGFQCLGLTMPLNWTVTYSVSLTGYPCAITYNAPVTAVCQHPCPPAPPGPNCAALGCACVWGWGPGTMSLPGGGFDYGYVCINRPGSQYLVSAYINAAACLAVFAALDPTCGFCAHPDSHFPFPCIGNSVIAAQSGSAVGRAFSDSSFLSGFSMSSTNVYSGVGWSGSLTETYTVTPGP